MAALQNGDPDFRVDPTTCEQCFPAGQAVEPAAVPQAFSGMVNHVAVEGHETGIWMGLGWVGDGSSLPFSEERRALIQAESRREQAEIARETAKREAAAEERIGEWVQMTGAAALTFDERIAAASMAMDAADRAEERRQKKFEQALLAGEIPASDPALIAHAQQIQKRREAREHAKQIAAEREGRAVTTATIDGLKSADRDTAGAIKHLQGVVADILAAAPNVLKRVEQRREQ
jgi:hypothetical protein